MMDDLATRVSLSLAAFLLLGTGLSLLPLSSQDPPRAAAEELVSYLARTVDEVSALDGALRLRAGPGEGIPVPVALAGRNFTLEFRARDIRIRTQGFEAAAPLHETLYAFAPAQAICEGDAIRSGAGQPLRIPSGSDFIVERASCTAQQSPRYLTFVYLP